NIAVYFPIAIVCISLYVVVADCLKARDYQGYAQSDPKQQKLCGFLIAFGLLTFIMYFKGFVRVSVTQMYLAIIPSLLLAAALFQQRFNFSRPLRLFITFVVSLSVLAPVWCSLREIKDLHKQQSSLLESMWSSVRGTRSAIRTTWCSLGNAATRGVCFF